MLAIARALLLNPRLLIMDEPSEGLAPIVVEHLVGILRDVATEGVGLLLVEQNLGIATSVSKRITIMVTGRIALETTSEELLADETVQRRYLGVSAQLEMLSGSAESQEVHPMASVVLLGTLDTKGPEYEFLRDRVREFGCDVVLVDAGVMCAGSPGDVTADEVAAAAGENRAALAAAGDRGPAVMAMTRGATEVVKRLYAEGRLNGILGVGGSGGSSIVAAAMQALPIGVPKLIVSTMASGDTRPYVGTSDIAMMYSVVDIAGINGISEKILTNAAAGIAGMARASSVFASKIPPKPLIGATMFGVTTPSVTTAREWLEAHGYEVLVFHATGAGGQSMEALMAAGFITGALDVTTTELADELIGGVLSAGPDRLEMAGSLGIPQVVSLGALDMCNFGPRDTVPAKFHDRNLYVHNATVTLMRTTEDECAELGRIIARKLNLARGPLTVFIPLGGVSMIAVPGGPFYDAAADAALIRELKAGLRPDVEMVEMATDINDPAFATAMAERLDAHYRAWAAAQGQNEGGPA